MKSDGDGLTVPIFRDERKLLGVGQRIQENR